MKIKNRMRITLLAISLIIHTLVTYAQQNRLFTAEHDISNSLINKVYQDSRGFIWIGTEYGLNKYDGTHFTIYKSDPHSSNSLPNNYIRTLFEDNTNRLWIGCINGLTIYDRDRDDFRQIPMYRAGKLVFPHVTHIQQLHNGDIWIATAGLGLFVVSGHQDKAVALDNVNNLAQTLFMSYILEDASQRIWIGTESNGLVCYTPLTRKVRIYKNPEITSNSISSIVEDTDGTIYVGTLNNGLNYLQPQSSTFVKVNDSSSMPIKCLAFDSKNRLLIGTDGQGLKEFQKSTGKIVTFKPENATYDLSGGKVHSLIHDTNNNLWLGVFQKGILFIPQSNYQFHNWNIQGQESNSIISHCVMSILKDSQGVIWATVDSEGLYKLTSEGSAIHHYTNNSANNSVPSTIMCMLEDSNHMLWLGSYTHGIASFDRNTGKCTYIDELTDKRIFAMAEDDNKMLYICTLGDGIYRYNLTTHSLDHYKGIAQSNQKLYDDSKLSDSEKVGIAMGVSSILFDGDHIWLGHFTGISCIDLKTNKFINNQALNKSLNGRISQSLLKDENENLWIGTVDGLFRYSLKDKKLTQYTQHQGLPCNVICGLCEDNNNHIWGSTFTGLFHLNPKTGDILSYFVGDGLQGSEFTRGAYFHDQNDEIFFGGINGITALYPSAITGTELPIGVHITEFHIFNQSVNSTTESGGNHVIQGCVMDCNNYHLSYNDNTITIGFSTMDFSNPDRIIYQYKMKGLSNEWTTTQPGTSKVTYNNLRPGHYVFMVQAIDGNRKSAIKEIHITIASPWYSTSWAYLLYFILFVIFLVALGNSIYGRIVRVRRQRERIHAEQINEAKLQFFVNISHEIRTPMTLIINPLEKLLKEENDKEHHRTYALMYRNGQRILQLINQLLDIRKIDKGQMFIKCQETDIVKFIQDIIQIFDYLAKNKNIKLNFIHPEPKLMVWIDMNKFDKVLLNLLSNAFKYTPNNGEITVSLSTGADYYEITVSDTGIGINPQQLDQIFERFFQIDNGGTNTGTGIGLHLTRSLVLLHHGTIKAENREDRQGSRFIVRLPLGCDHLKKEELVDPDERKNMLPYIQALNENKVEEIHLESESEEGPEKVHSKTNSRILIVEDEKDIQQYLSKELMRDYRIETCDNGKEALEIALKNAPDLIISDIMMPGMDGLTLCKKIKQNININHIPIILLSAKSRFEDRMEGLETGADAYFVKPFNTEELKVSIVNLLANRKMLQNKYNGSQEQEDKVKKIHIKSSDEALMEKVMNVINQNMDDPSFSVDKLANEVGLSRVHLHRKLKELTNQSARDFIRSVRLKQAANLLAEKKMNIADVSYAVGFSSPSHFSTVFKEFYGISPTEYMITNAKEETNTTDLP